MANKLREMGSLSAGKREENIYKVFVYLHTREQFHPVNLKTKVLVSDKTILSYLNQIQDAQLLTKPYRQRLLELKATEHSDKVLILRKNYLFWTSWRTSGFHLQNSTTRVLVKNASASLSNLCLHVKMSWRLCGSVWSSLYCSLKW